MYSGLALLKRTKQSTVNFSEVDKLRTVNRYDGRFVKYPKVELLRKLLDILPLLLLATEGSGSFYCYGMHRTKQSTKGS